MLNFPEAVTLLKQHGIDVNAKTWVRATQEVSFRQRIARRLQGREEAEPEPEPELESKEDLGWVGKTSLHYAALGGNHKIVEMLCESNARCKALDNSSPNLKPPQGNTALHYAAIGGSLECVQVLLDQNKKAVDSLLPLDGIAKVGERVLYAGHESREREEVLVLQVFWYNQHGAKIFTQETVMGEILPPMYVVRSATGRVFESKHSRLFKLIPLHVDTNQRNGDGNSALHFAVAQGNLAMTTLLVDNQADVNSQGNWKEYYEPSPHCGRTPLHNATDPAIAELLLRSGGDIHAVDNRQMTPLHHAAAEDAPGVAAALIRVLVAELKESIQQASTTPSSEDRPVSDDQRPPAKYKPDLIVPYITAKDDLGSTPLHIASFWGHSEFFRRVADALKEMGAYELEAAVLAQKENSPALKDDTGRTRLHHAAWGDRGDEIRNLLRRGAKVNCLDRKGRTPLHFAAMYGSAEAARALLEAGADPDALDGGDWESNTRHLAVRRPGYTPLHHAARKGYAEVAAVLLDGVGDKRADPRAMTDDGGAGQTALGVAKQFKWNDTAEVCRLLKQHGGGGGAGCAIC